MIWRWRKWKESRNGTHTRAKQRTDKKETRFLVHVTLIMLLLRTTLRGLRATLGNSLEECSEREPIWNSPLGKNMISGITKEMTKLRGKESSNDFTYSLRRTSATPATDNDATAQQLVDFYGWQNPNMPQDYVSSARLQLVQLLKNSRWTLLPSNKEEQEIFRDVKGCNWIQNGIEYQNRGASQRNND